MHANPPAPPPSPAPPHSLVPSVHLARASFVAVARGRKILCIRTPGFEGSGGKVADDFFASSVVVFDLSCGGVEEVDAVDGHAVERETGRGLWVYRDLALQ